MPETTILIPTNNCGKFIEAAIKSILSQNYKDYELLIIDDGSIDNTDEVISVPENDPDYEHDYEGSDDMPAHLKAALLGTSVLIPITNGKPAFGTWQGIYLCEHRNYSGNRSVVITAWGL